MTLKLEIGKKYKDRSNNTVTIFKEKSGTFLGTYSDETGYICSYAYDSVGYCYGNDHLNLTAEHVAENQLNESTSAVKYDSGKPRVSLLPTEALLEVVKVLSFGAKKYGDYNWTNGFDWSRLTDAQLRHILAFNNGEDKDPESQISHIAHAVCGGLMLLQHILLGLGKDDRYKPTKKTA